MAESLSTLLPLMQLPRCPDNTMLAALRTSCRQFCRDTEIWREILDEAVTVADQSEYTLDFGYDDALLIRVTGVEIDSVPQHGWTVTTAGVLTLANAPIEDDLEMSVYVVLMPTLFCSEVAEELVTRWGGTIAAGAAAQLKADPGSRTDPVPWYDPSGAGLKQMTYETGVGEAKAELFMELQAPNQMVEIIAWGRT